MTNGNIKFQLSPNMIVTEIKQDIGNVGTGLLQNVIIGKITGRIYIINDTIKLFMSFFKTPVTYEEAYAAFKRVCMDAGIPTGSSFKMTVSDFFRSMCKQGFIIDAEKAEQVKLLQQKLPIPSIDGYSYVETIKIKQHVFLGLYESLLTGNTVVVKRLNLENITNKQKTALLPLFMQEFEIMAEASVHPAVCKIISFDEHSMTGIIEHLQGATLKDYIRENVLDLNQKYVLFNQVLDVFSFLHTNQILHGDIHASNFIVTEGNIVRLIDFGLSHHTNLHDSEIVKGGGVYYYIPPERVSDDAFKVVNGKMADCTSEVYQLGVLLYYIVYERVPFDEFTWKLLVDAIANKAPQFDLVTKNNESIQTIVIDILKRALHKDPKKRYTSASEMQKEWREYFTKMLTCVTV